MKTPLRIAAFALSLAAISATPLFAEQQDAAAQAIAKLKAAGALVLPVAQGSDELTVNFAVQGQKAGDAEIAPLKEAGKVVDLNLGSTKVTDAGMKVVASLSGLRRLDLHLTAVGDAGVGELKGLANLDYLNLYGTKVGDAGLKSVAALASLSRLYLWQTAVTDAGVAELQKALPKLVVNRGAPPPVEVAKTCCEKAAAEGKACDHPCCKTAAEKGRICYKCNPDKATTCCDKAEVAGKACDHPCCKAAAEKGRICFKCNPDKAKTCCEKAEAAGKECDHPCCIEARKAGKICEKCNSVK